MHKKNFLIDTSVLLDSPLHIVSLSQNGENNLFISDIILKELNKHKEDGMSEKGFLAREFIRSLDNGIIHSKFVSEQSKMRSKNRKQRAKKNVLKQEVFSTVKGDTIHAFECLFEGHNKPIIINIINREKYNQNSSINDLKIVEIAKDYKFELITNDIALKIIALSKSIEADSLKKDSVRNPENILFHKETISTKEDLIKVKQQIIKSEKIWTQVTIKEVFDYKDKVVTGKEDFYIISPLGLESITSEDDIKKLKVKPLNLEQKFYEKMLRSDFNILTVTGSTGSGKTLLALQEGMRRVKDKDDPIDGIIYMRNTVTANDKASELGFRKGDEDQKLGYFAYPLFGAINFINDYSFSKEEKIDLRAKKDEKKGSTLKEDHTKAFMEEYNIELMDIAHARGVTVTNKFLIFDELQNASNQTMQLIGTRVGKNTKIVLMGDFRQVDHPYLTKNRNALVSMLKKSEKDNYLAAIQLKHTIRSETANWFQENL